MRAAQTCKNAHSGVGPPRQANALDRHTFGFSKELSRGRFASQGMESPELAPNAPGKYSIQFAHTGKLVRAATSPEKDFQTNESHTSALLILPRYRGLLSRSIPRVLRCMSRRLPITFAYCWWMVRFKWPGQVPFSSQLIRSSDNRINLSVS